MIHFLVRIRRLTERLGGYPVYLKKNEYDRSWVCLQIKCDEKLGKLTKDAGVFIQF